MFIHTFSFFFFFFNDTATTEIYTSFPTRRSSDLAARTMAYLIISPPTISRHVCGPNGLPPAGLGYSVPVVTPCRPTYACPQILPSASYKSRNHCFSKLSDGARGGTFMYWAMVYLVELAGAAIHELDPERRL